MDKYYLICYQQRRIGRPDWQIANCATDKEPGLWLVDTIAKHQESHDTVLLSATPITQGVYRIAKNVL